MKGDDTKNNIFQSLCTLLESRPLKDINIADIAKGADISRQTFYYHFGSILEVFKWAVTSRTRFRNPKDTGRYYASPTEWLYDFCQAVYQVKDLAHALMYGGYAREIEGFFREYMSKACYDSAKYFLFPSLPEDHIRTFARFHAEGYFVIAREWARSGMESDLMAELENLRGGFALMMPPNLGARNRENILK